MPTTIRSLAGLSPGRAGSRRWRVTNETPGLRQLGYGLSFSAAVIVISRLWEFFAGAAAGQHSEFGGVAWLLLLAIILLTVLSVPREANMLSLRTFLIICLGLAGVVALDLLNLEAIAVPFATPTAAIAAGGVLLALATLRPPYEVAAATLALAVTLVTHFLVLPPGDLEQDSKNILISSLAVVPAAVALLIVTAYRRMASMALDRVAMQARVTAPSAEGGRPPMDGLREIDREIEDLFGRVAAGSEPLPLSPNRAAQAQRLATELRSMLVARQQSSWLTHALTEGSLLHTAVTLEDSDNLAARLDQEQRDGLLSALWLICAIPRRRAPRVLVRVDRRTLADDTARIRLDVTGLHRGEIDFSTWEALSRVGRFTDSAILYGFRVEIDCGVNPRS